ncbi:hypothetical protein [Brevibacterium aurantiacum]|uniref:Uncharacterized protein n=1 Tax=Brevibacterium aurantiacum TaxID=273384 RepID=A0A556CB69_BREAU|nr:hypothetical protein [Brevibacterium aurantiacum]TSI14650.1 hypothetical protein FO013_14980 [Brevibacterium aurantiacum]
MVTESEFAKAAMEFHLAVNAARQAQVEVDDARWAMEEMQCLKEFQLMVPYEDGDGFAFVVTLCERRKGHDGPHGEEPMTSEYESAVILDEVHTIRKDTGWVREMGRKARALFALEPDRG